MASLEAELSEVKLQTHVVEQENLLLRDELEKLKQVRSDMVFDDVSPATKRLSHCGCSTSSVLQVKDLKYKCV